MCSRRPFPYRPTRQTPRQLQQPSSSVSLSYFRFTFQVVFRLRLGVTPRPTLRPRRSATISVLTDALCASENIPHMERSLPEAAKPSLRKSVRPSASPLRGICHSRRVIGNNDTKSPSSKQVENSVLGNCGLPRHGSTGRLVPTYGRR